MARRFRLRPQVFGGAYQAGVEVALPDAIDDGSRRGRRTTVAQPVSERQPGRLIAFFHWVEESRNTRLHNLGQLQEISSFQQVSFA